MYINNVNAALFAAGGLSMSYKLDYRMSRDFNCCKLFIYTINALAADLTMQ